MTGLGHVRRKRGRRRRRRKKSFGFRVGDPVDAGRRTLVGAGPGSGSMGPVRGALGFILS